VSTGCRNQLGELTCVHAPKRPVQVGRSRHGQVVLDTSPRQIKGGRCPSLAGGSTAGIGAPRRAQRVVNLGPKGRTDGSRVPGTTTTVSVA